MDITLDLSLLVGLVSIPVVMPLLVQHAKRFVAWARRESEGSPWPLVAVLATLAWVHALDRARVLEGELGTDELNAWAVTLVGLAIGAIAPLGYDGWRHFRRGADSGQPQQ